MGLREPAMATEFAPCNQHACGLVSLPTCHLEHVRCHVRQISHDNSYSKRPYLNNCAHSRIEDNDKCWESPQLNGCYKNVFNDGAHGVALTQACHLPDSDEERALGLRLKAQYESCINAGPDENFDGSAAHWHGFAKPCKTHYDTIVVTHDRKGMGSIDAPTQKDAFHCSKTSSGSCQCKCNQHPECCSLENKVLGGKVIQGNRYDNVANKQDCCNLCTNHPMCTGWVYDSMQVCILKQGEQAYEENQFADEITTWAGRPSGVACTQ